MNWINQLERRYGHWAIPHLLRGVVIINFLLWLPARTSPAVRDFLLLDRDRVLDGEIWRLFTFVLLPPNADPLFLIFVFFFMWMIAEGLESAWGAFRLNLFYLMGVLGTAIAGMFFMPGAVGNEYLNTSLLFAFATVYPDYVIYFMLLIPMRMKWVGLISAAGLLLVAIGGTWGQRAAILVAFLNYLIFFYPALMDLIRLNRQTSRARARFHGSMKPEEGETFHRCTQCGRTEREDPGLDFRIAENGHEYCEEHLPGGLGSEG